MDHSFQFRVTGEEAGRRLDEFLASRFAALTRLRIANIVSAGACLVNEQQAPPGYRISAGDLIVISFDEGPPTAMQPERVPIEILYEDDHIIVVVKPAGMLVHPTRSVKSGTLANALAYHLNKDFYESPKSHHAKPERREGDVKNTGHQTSDIGHRTSDFGLQTPDHGQSHSLIRPGLVHRLDRATSGLMVIAKTARALSRLTIHFRRRLVEKRYLALVHGVVAEDEGVIVAPIGRDPDRRPQWWVTEDGKEAETRFRVRERFRRSTLVEMEPITGRTNQLRIHCAHAGHPVLGDELYGSEGRRQKAEGSEEASPDDELANQEQMPEIEVRLPITAFRLLPSAYRPARLCLHAAHLSFYHPASNQRMQFDSPLPDDFASVLNSEVARTNDQ